jgi:hypothetical protein
MDTQDATTEDPRKECMIKAIKDTVCGLESQGIELEIPYETYQSSRVMMPHFKELSKQYLELFAFGKHIKPSSECRSRGFSQCNIDLLFVIHGRCYTFSQVPLELLENMSQSLETKPIVYKNSHAPEDKDLRLAEIKKIFKFSMTYPFSQISRQNNKKTLRFVIMDEE